MLETAAFEDLFLYSYDTYFIQGFLKKHEEKPHMYWTLHGGSMCNPSWQFHNFIPIWQQKCPSGDKANFQFDLVEKKILRIREDSNVFLLTMDKSKTQFDFVFYLIPLMRENRVKM